MSRTPSAALVASAVLAGLLSSGLWDGREIGAAAPLDLTCSAQAPTVPLGGTVTVKAWARSPAGRALRYTWTATAGRIEGRGAEARWNLAELRPGTFAASVTAADGGSVSAECLVRVTVRRDAQPRGMSRETGRFFLVSGQPETAGYGLYSYLLLGAPPSEASRERYLKAIDAYLSLVPDVVSLEEYVPRGELNIFYAPVRDAPAPSVTAQWVLDNYDYARARSVLRILPSSNRDGPYILAAFKPLGGTAAAAAGPYLFQDLSSVPPHLAASWVREFLNQAAQERFWQEKKGEQLAQRLRATVGIMGAGLPEVRKSLDTWIAWVH
jgi:hypothetical protein